MYFKHRKLSLPFKCSDFVIKSWDEEDKTQAWLKMTDRISYWLHMLGFQDGFFAFPFIM